MPDDRDELITHTERCRSPLRREGCSPQSRVADLFRYLEVKLIRMVGREI
jgi:hypothetical protein